MFPTVAPMVKLDPIDRSTPCHVRRFSGKLLPRKACAVHEAEILHCLWCHRPAVAAQQPQDQQRSSRSTSSAAARFGEEGMLFWGGRGCMEQSVDSRPRLYHGNCCFRYDGDVNESGFSNRLSVFLRESSQCSVRKLPWSQCLPPVWQGGSR